MRALRIQDLPQEMRKFDTNEVKSRCSTSGLLYTTSSKLGCLYNPVRDEWKDYPELQWKKQFKAMVPNVDTVYACGTGSGVFIMDDELWMSKPAMATKKTGFGAVMLDGILYVCGGSKKDSNFQRFCNGWQTLPSMNYSRFNPAVESMNGKLYAVGGEMNEKILRKAECYDPVQNEWREIADMKQARTAFKIVAAGGFLYAVGGGVELHSVGENKFYSPTNLVERYDPKSNSWSLVASLIGEPVCNSGVAFWNEKIYCIGGTQGDRLATASVKIYDPQTNKWSQGTSLPCPVPVATCLVLKKSQDSDMTLFDTVPYGPENCPEIE